MTIELKKDYGNGAYISEFTSEIRRIMCTRLLPMEKNIFQLKLEVFV